MCGKRVSLSYCVVLLCILALIAGCSTHHEEDRPPGSPAVILTDPGHGSSDAPIITNGNEYVEDYGANNGPGQTSPEGFIIAPGGNDDLAWAKYIISGLDIARPVDLELDVASVIAPGGNDDLPLIYKIAIFDYTNNIWEWHGPYTENGYVVLNSNDIRHRYVSDTGVFRFQVLTDSSNVPATPENPDGITAVEIIASVTTSAEEYYTTEPHYTILTFSRGTCSLAGSSQKVTLNWQHIIDLSHPDNEAKEYRVYRKVAGDPEIPLSLAKVKAPSTQFIDPDMVQNPNRRMVPGATYVYYIQSKNYIGETSLTVTPEIVTTLFAPDSLDASDGTYPGVVVLVWNKAVGAQFYEIFRDDQSAPVAVVGDVDEWVDTGVEEGMTHTYWLRSVNEYATSVFSDPDTGYAGT